MEYGSLYALVAGAVLLITLAGFGIVSSILHYHWRHYELDTDRHRRARVFYFAGAAVIILFTLGAFANLFL